MRSVAIKLPQQEQIIVMLRYARDRYLARLDRTARKLMTFLDLHMETVISRWLAVVALLAVAKLVIAPFPVRGIADLAGMAVPFLLVALSPVFAYRVATGSFPRKLLSAQPAMRFARLGQWRRLNVVEARSHPAFGPYGIMASLTFGLLMNVPFRSLEFLASMPAIGAGAPHWAHILQWAMTADVVVMNFFYTVCFVMALRSVPLFPRMLVFAWVMDIAMQLVVTNASVSYGLPTAVVSAMGQLVEGNIRKVFISIAVWLPYLILSERVNVTFRHRSAC